MKSWNSATEDITLKDGTVVKEYDIRFRTTDRKIYKRIERFFQDIMDEADTPQTDCYMCKWMGDRDVCGRCRNRNLFAVSDTPQTEDWKTEMLEDDIRADCPWK